MTEFDFKKRERERQQQNAMKETENADRQTELDAKARRLADAILHAFRETNERAPTPTVQLSKVTLKALGDPEDDHQLTITVNADETYYVVFGRTATGSTLDQNTMMDKVFEWYQGQHI
jgi:hypothetical protein